MAKYLIEASYTTEGLKGVMKEGGTGRREAVEKVAANLGGHVEAFYFAFGENDAYVLVDLPDNTNAAAVSLAVGATGTVHTKTTVLLTPEEIDSATKMSTGFRPAGQ